MVKHVDHINIVVANLERSVHFYTELLGLKETRRAHLTGDWIEAIVGLRGVSADVVYVQPCGGGPRIELIKYLAPEGVSIPENALPNTQGLRHIAFQVEDMDSLYTRLVEAGVKFIGAPVIVPKSVIEHDDGQKSLCYFHDPDGVVLELAAYV
ncbi:MAG: VOC family protein [Candidatus Hydrogenedentes bacterium]|nr:VOC family protein [Candidatus Hydrogenedentota bacterium]